MSREGVRERERGRERGREGEREAELEGETAMAGGTGRSVRRARRLVQQNQLEITARDLAREYGTR